MTPKRVQQVLALEGFLDKHDELLAASKAEYLSYAADKIEELEFQTELVNQALAAKRIWAAELATGIGKSVIAARIAADRAQDGPVIYVSPNATSIGNIETGVVNKFLRTFAAANKPVHLGLLNDLSRANDVSFVTPRVLVATLQREPDRICDLLRRASCFIVDEAHHFPEDIERELTIFGRLYEAADAHVRDGLTVAMTGTWTRLDRRRVMGREKPDARLTVQDAVNLRRCAELYGIQVITDVRAKKATTQGDLYDFHLRGEERLAYLQGVVDCMVTVSRRYPVPFAAFAATVTDARAIALRYNEAAKLDEARGLIVLTASTPLSERIRAVNDIIARRRVGYITCAVGEEAIDIPALEVVHLIRRTRSSARNSQAVGRGLRVCTGKRRALVIDYQTMLEGIQDRFLGLNCDDLATDMGAVGPRINGGPLVSQRNYPQGVLTGMTMSEERAVVCVNVSSKTQNQNALLKLAKENAVRPKYNTALGKALTNYTTQSGHSFDAAFTRALFDLRPDWAVVNESGQKKASLQQLAQNGQPRPAGNTVLGRAAKRYLTPSSKSYDKALADEIRQLQPGWFQHQDKADVVEYKRKVLASARTGMLRPSGQAWERLKRLMRADKTFRDELYTACPAWRFSQPARRKSRTNAKAKAKLRAYAGEHATRPSGPLAEILCRYCTRTASSAHDPALTAELRALRPHWFQSSAATVKQELLARAARNEPRPSVANKAESKLYWNLWGYVRPGGKVYDPEFAAQLFALRPDWRFKSPPKTKMAKP